MVVSDAGWDDLDRVLRLGHDEPGIVWAEARELFGEP
jgi:hypothetical protein